MSKANNLNDFLTDLADGIRLAEANYNIEGASTEKINPQNFRARMEKLLSSITSTDPNLIAENIKKGVTIFGVTGTFVGLVKFIVTYIDWDISYEGVPEDWVQTLQTIQGWNWYEWCNSIYNPGEFSCTKTGEVYYTSEAGKFPVGAFGDELIEEGDEGRYTIRRENGIITFETIDGRGDYILRTAKYGQTWYDWCRSSYNTGGFFCTSPSGPVYYPDRDFGQITVSHVIASDTIINNYSYSVDT